MNARPVSGRLCVRTLATVALLWADASVGAAGEIHSLLESGQLAKAKALLAKDPRLVHALDRERQTPLHVAAARGHVEIVQILLKMNCKVDARAHYRETPLHMADGPEIAKLLVEHKADLTARGGVYDRTPLQAVADRSAYRDPAGELRCQKTARVLIDAGADYDVESAVRLGDAARVRALFQTDPALAKRTDLWRTAAEDGRAAVVALMLEYKADPNHTDHTGRTLLFLAAGRPAVVKVLLGAGVDPKAPVRFQVDLVTVFTVSVLSEAASKGEVESAKLLIARGVVVDAVAVQQAVRNGRPEMVAYLLDQKSGNDLLAADGPKLVRLAASQIRGAESDDTEDANRRYQHVVAVLRKSGAPVDFLSAISVGDTPLAKRLLEEDPTLARSTNTQAGKLALHRAVELDRREVVAALLDHGADVNLRDDGFTPLHTAAFWGREEIATLLIDRKADVHAVMAPTQSTPLHSSARCSSVGVARRLLAAGAKVNAKEAAGQTPLGCAKQVAARWERARTNVPKDALDMIELLRKHGGKE